MVDYDESLCDLGGQAVPLFCTPIIYYCHIGMLHIEMQMKGTTSFHSLLHKTSTISAHLSGPLSTCTEGSSMTITESLWCLFPWLLFHVGPILFEGICAVLVLCCDTLSMYRRHGYHKYVLLQSLTFRVFSILLISARWECDSFGRPSSADDLSQLISIQSFRECIYMCHFDIDFHTVYSANKRAYWNHEYMISETHCSLLHCWFYICVCFFFIL